MTPLGAGWEQGYKGPVVIGMLFLMIALCPPLPTLGSATTTYPTSTSALRSACCSWHCSVWSSALCGASSGMRTSECCSLGGP